jgi:LCP family protein required for cell wall assembly
MSEGSDPQKPPEYRVYGSGRRSPGKARKPPAKASGEPPPYRVYRARPRGLLARLRGEEEALEQPRRRGSEPSAGGGPRRRVTPLRVLAYALLALLGWLLVSLVLFVVSAQIEQSNVSNRAKAALSGGGTLPFSANTILVLGSDQRVKGTKEPGANTGGPSRTDTILLMRIGGGKSAKLSIPRDTDVNIPGHGLGRINSAYSYGGAALSIRTVERLLGIKINHLIEVNFKNFPTFIDSLGGVTVKTGCVLSLINGGTRNGGFTLRLRKGEHHLSGKQALALARTRKNKCPGHANENDLTRAKRQQLILSALKGQLTGPTPFFRLPWVSWTAPKAVRSDMGGFSLLGLAAAVLSGKSAKPAVLPVVPNAVGGGLHVLSEQAKRRAVARFLKG